MKTPYILVWMGIILCSTAGASDSSGKFNVLSMGAKSCGQVVSDFKEDGIGKLANSAWVGGYLTAINAEVYRGFDVARGADPAARDLWIFNFCSKKPLDSLYTATDALVVQLKTRTR